MNGRHGEGEREEVGSDACLMEWSTGVDVERTGAGQRWQTRAPLAVALVRWDMQCDAQMMMTIRHVMEDEAAATLASSSLSLYSV